MTHDPPENLAALGAAYNWGTVHEVTYLPTGLMNDNWRVRTDAGVFALKQIQDASTTLTLTRRNLRVLAGLVDDGIPACRPRLTIDGDTVAEIEGRGYCLLSWLDGSHPTGLELSLAQSRDLGVLVARIHQTLDQVGSAMGLPNPPASVRTTVTAPADAVAAADRYLVAARAGTSPAFDAAVVRLLNRRKILIGMTASDRPADDQPRGPVGWTHGDLQYRNVVWRHGRVTGVLDWDRIRVRPLGEEIARTATVQFSGDDGRLDLRRIAAFVSGYRSVNPLPDAALTDAANRLFWKRISDFWHLVFHYDRGDHSCDDLFLLGEATLDWWAAHRDEVLRAFVATERAQADGRLATLASPTNQEAASR